MDYNEEEFEALVTKFQEAYEEAYHRFPSYSEMYWDAVRYDLYGFVPCYAEGKL